MFSKVVCALSERDIFSDVSFSFENISTVGEFTLEVTGNNSRQVIVAIYICYGDNFQLIETQILR